MFFLSQSLSMVLKKLHLTIKANMPQARCTENLVKFRCVVFEISEQTDRQTCWSQYFASYWGESINGNKADRS